MSLADSFLEDLDDLDSDGEGENTGRADGGDEEGGLDDLDAVLGDMQAAEGLSSVASLRQSEAYRSQMARIEESLGRPAEPIIGNVESNPDYQLIVSCNDLVQKIDEEVPAAFCFSLFFSSYFCASLSYLFKNHFFICMFVFQPRIYACLLAHLFHDI